MLLLELAVNIGIMIVRPSKEVPAKNSPNDDNVEQSYTSMNANPS